jgi:hypothetical protein
MRLVAILSAIGATTHHLRLQQQASFPPLPGTELQEIATRVANSAQIATWLSSLAPPFRLSVNQGPPTMPRHVPVADMEIKRGYKRVPTAYLAYLADLGPEELANELTFDEMRYVIKAYGLKLAQSKLEMAERIVEYWENPDFAAAPTDKRAKPEGKPKPEQKTTTTTETIKGTFTNASEKLLAYLCEKFGSWALLGSAIGRGSLLPP